MHEPTRIARATRLLALAAVYAVIASASSVFVTGTPRSAWLPAGIALAALIIYGRRLWPGIWLGTAAYLALPPPLGAGWPAWVAVVAGVVTAGEALFGSTLIGLTGFDNGLRRPRDVVVFLGMGAVLAPAVAAIGGAALLRLGELASATSAWTDWWVFASGDALGITVIAPVLLSFLGSRTPSWERCGPTWEAAIVGGIIVWVAFVVFGPGAFPITASWPFVLFPLVMWAALRFRTRGAALALLLIGCIATWGTLSGTGPFSTGDLTVDMSRMQLFVGVLSGTGLMLAAVVAEREAGASRLAASESRLRAIVEQSRDGISIGSPDGTVLVYNAAMERISGFTQQEVDERGWFDCVYPDDGLREEALRLAAQAVEGEAPYLELPIKRKDGVVRWVSFSTTPIVLEGRTYNLSIIGDVTERRAAETRLRDLDSIIRRSQAVAFRWSREEGWPIEFVSDNVAHWGYDAGDLTGVSYMRLLHPDDVSRIAAEVEANLLEGHAEFTEEYRIVTKDGRTRWVEDSTWVLPGEEHVLGVVVDVTERRELELERTMLHDVVERSLNEVYVFDVDTLRFGYVNEAAAENLGYPRERLLELTPVDLKPEFDRESFASLIEPLKAGTTDNVVFETIHQRADGSTYPVEVRLQIADTAHGRVFVAIINDITARKAAEAAAEDYREHLEALVAERTASLEDANEELQAVNEELAAANEELAVNNEELAHSSAEIMRMNAELQEATRAKSDFLAAMSHELRTPLNSILGFSEILLEGMAGPLNEEQSKQLSMINSSGKHLLELINDVLDLSRIEAGRMPLTVGEFELREEIEPLVRGLSAQAAEKDLTLVAEYPPEPVLMRTDARKVRQILLNLLSNAVKFTDRGQVRMTVSTTKEGASIVVSDTGPGIAEADQPALFEPFTQASTTVAGKPEGTGLGLAISARLAETLGGTLVVASRPGEGAVFTLEIPQRLTLE